jgi:hypothetical protein
MFCIGTKLHVTLWEKQNLQGLNINHSIKYLDLWQGEEQQFRILQNSKCFIPIDNLVLLGQ